MTLYGNIVQMPTLGVIKKRILSSKTVKYPTLRVQYPAGCQMNRHILL